MIITSSQQIADMMNPSNTLDLSEFEDITLRFGSFICISKRKKFNFLNFLKFLIEDEDAKQIYFKLLGENNLQIIIKAYLSSTPNIYKKIFRSKLNMDKKSANSNI